MKNCAYANEYRIGADNALSYNTFLPSELTF